MTDSADNKGITSRNVMEFITVAAEYCLFLEKVEAFKRIAVLEKLQKLCPLLYLKGSLLPELDSRIEGSNEKFVSEEEWFAVQDQLLLKLGAFDTYQAEIDPLSSGTDEPAGGSIAEDLTDVYQELKDFISLFNIGGEESMNDALWEIRENFCQWGDKILIVLRAVHNVLNNGESLEETEDELSGKDLYQDDTDMEKMNTKDWILSRRMKEWNNDGPGKD